MLPMTRIAKHALLPYAAERLFDLVNDIEAYPRFMDGCTGAAILHQQEDMIEARLDLAKAGISQSLITRNRLVRPEYIYMELVDGPFESLSGYWQFQSLTPEACKVMLQLEFELNSRLASIAVGKLFETVAGNQVDSLCKRANMLFSETPVVRGVT